MPRFLPLRANVNWLKKTAKQKLAAHRSTDPDAKLAAVQLAIARDYGFASWRKMIAHVEEVREKLRALIPDLPDSPEGAQPIPPDDPGLARLLVAVESGDATAVTGLLQCKPALAAAHGPDGQTPLHAAARRDDARIGLILLAYGADPNDRFGVSGHTALSWAVTCHATGFARTIVRLGVVPDLFEAAGMGALESVKEFFDETGRLMDGASQTGSSRYSPDGSRLPCPPETAVEQVSDALCMACRNGHADVVRFLLTCQPDLSFRAFAGGTALHWACFGGSKQAVEMLVRAGADETARDSVLGCTPRAFGVCTPASWGLQFLVEARLRDDPALLNFMDGRTSVLHEAAAAGHAGIVQFLLGQGADAGLRDGDGKLALDRASERGHDRVAQLLRAVASG